LRLSFGKLAFLHPELLEDAAPMNVHGQIAKLVYQTIWGDANPAMVVGVKPDALFVAAYSADIDCVVLLRFPVEFAIDQQLKAGSRLIALNSYEKKSEIAADLKPGAESDRGRISIHTSPSS